MRVVVTIKDLSGASIISLLTDLWLIELDISILIPGLIPAALDAIARISTISSHRADGTNERLFKRLLI